MTANHTPLTKEEKENMPSQDCANALNMVVVTASHFGTYDGTNFDEMISDLSDAFDERDVLQKLSKHRGFTNALIDLTTAIVDASNRCHK